MGYAGPSSPTEAEVRAYAERMRRDARETAKLFVQAAEAGDVETFMFALGRLQSEIDGGMPVAMKLAARIKAPPEVIQGEFLALWIMSNNLSLHVRDRRSLAAALRVLLPRQKQTTPLPVYRGATFKERKTHAYGFSWTTKVDAARGFAERWREFEGGAVVLETTAPAEAILQTIDGTATSFESEVIVDPFKLRSVRVMERLAPKAKR